MTQSGRFHIRCGAVFVLGMALATGCAKYRPEPLNPVQTLAVVAHQRLHPEGAGNSNATAATMTDDFSAIPDRSLTLALATAWLRRCGPGVQEALAEYRTTSALAGVKTPFPNPGLELGPQMGFGPDTGVAQRFAPFGSIRLAIPIGGRRGRQDELNLALAELARIEALARFRDEYLMLRERYAILAIARSKAKVCRVLAEGASRTLEAGKRLAMAGQAGALEVTLFELELQRAKINVLTADQEVIEAESALAELLGVHHSLLQKLPDSALPTFPQNSPSLENLRRQLLNEHSELGRLRAQYEVAERALRLEVAKQYPDIQIGPLLEKETGSRSAVLGLTLGIELPLFERNQQAIAEARKRREEVRAKYEAALKRALARLERAVRVWEQAAVIRALHGEKLRPMAQTNVALARRSLEAGEADVLKVLDAERSEREAQLELLKAELDEHLAWMGLEQAVGRPLVAFPSEHEEHGPLPGEPLGASAGSWPPARMVEPEEEER